MATNKKTRKSGKIVFGKQTQFKRIFAGIKEVTIGRALNKRGRQFEKEGMPVPLECVIREEFTFEREVFKTAIIVNGQMKKLFA